jgi:hypothetical protein
MVSTPDFVGYNHTAPVFLAAFVRITFDTKYVGISRSISVTTSTSDGISSPPNRKLEMFARPSCYCISLTRQATRTALLWAITQWVVVISYRRFGTTLRSHLKESKHDSLSLQIGQIDCPETPPSQNSAVFIYIAAEAWNQAQDGQCNCME